MFKKENIKNAFVASIPFIIGFIPVSFICGVLLQSAGLSLFQSILMSVFVYAGSSQFIAASMIGSMSSIISIVITTFIVNLRHLLYSSSLSVHVEEKSVPKLLLMGHYITDETFAVNYEMYQTKDWNDDTNILLGIFGQIYWLIGIILGSLLGDIIEIPTEIASFSLIAMFIVLITLQITERKKLIVSLVTIPIALFIMNLYTGSLNIVIISLIGASVGYILDLAGEKYE